MDLGTHLAKINGFWEKHICDLPCHILHTNDVKQKKFMRRLQLDSTGSTCKREINTEYLTNTIFKNDSADYRMFELVYLTCCPHQ